MLLLLLMQWKNRFTVVYYVAVAKGRIEMNLLFECTYRWNFKNVGSDLLLGRGCFINNLGDKGGKSQSRCQPELSATLLASPEPTKLCN